MKTAGKPPIVTRQELHRAEEGLVRLLHAKRFPREWIERHVPDVMAQARTDFAARLAAGREDDTVNLLVVIGYRRAIKVLNAELSRPSTTSIETVFHLADDSAPTPEEKAIEHDRREQVVRAMSHLPERERKLLALVYFDGKSVRDAGRHLGWGKSSADRHHRAALEQLHEMLDRSLLSPEIAVPAYIAARHWQHSPLRGVLRWVEGAAETLGEGLVLGSSRIAQIAEAGSAAATSGAGRTAAGVCGTVVMVCLTGAATGVVGPGVGALDAQVDESRPPARRPAASAEEVPAPTVEERPAAVHRAPAEGGGSPSKDRLGRAPDGKPVVAAGRQPAAGEPGAGRMSSTPQASPGQAVEEFGVESGEGGPPPAEAATRPVPAPLSRPPTEHSGSSGSSDASGSPGAGTPAEFSF